MLDNYESVLVYTQFDILGENLQTKTEMNTETAHNYRLMKESFDIRVYVVT